MRNFFFNQFNINSIIPLSKKKENFLFSFNGLFYLLALVRFVVNQKASTETDVVSKIEGVLKDAPDKIGAHGRLKIYHKDKPRLDM